MKPDSIKEGKICLKAARFRKFALSSPISKKFAGFATIPKNQHLLHSKVYGRKIYEISITCG